MHVRSALQCASAVCWLPLSWVCACLHVCLPVGQERPALDSSLTPHCAVSCCALLRRPPPQKNTHEHTQTYTATG